MNGNYPGTNFAPLFYQTAQHLLPPSASAVVGHPQASQYVAPQPDFTALWFQAYVHPRPTPPSTDPVVGHPQPSQYQAPQPDYTDWWRQRKVWPILVSTAKDPVPPTYVLDLSWRHPQPDYWAEYQAYVQPPQAAGYVPPRPPTHQPSQYLAPEPEYADLWWQVFLCIPASEHVQPVRDAPLPHQASQQLSYALPEDWTLWDALRQPPAASTYVPPNPPTRQPDQHYEPPVDHNALWWQQHATWPLPTGYVPAPPPSRQPSQWHPEPPPWDIGPWLQRVNYVQPVPGSFTVIHAGVFGVYNEIFRVGQTGLFRVANDIAGYLVYVAQDAPPDPTTVTPVYAAALPVSVPLVPPPSGLRTYYVLVRRRNQYTLESQNSYCYTFTIDSAGVLQLPPLPTPVQLQLHALAGGVLQVLAIYPGFASEQYPATEWRVWAGLTPPNPLVDPPAKVVPIEDDDPRPDVLSTQLLGPYAPGLYTVVVELYRADDAALSAPVSGTVTMPDSPDQVVPVRSGFQEDS